MVKKTEKAIRAVAKNPTTQMGVTDYVDFTYIDMPVEERRKLDVGNIFLNQGKALCCGWIIRSKNRHHYAKCRCGKASIDGGSWYTITSGKVELHTVNYSHLEETDDEEEE